MGVKQLNARVQSEVLVAMRVYTAKHSITVQQFLREAIREKLQRERGLKMQDVSLELGMARDKARGLQNLLLDHAEDMDKETQLTLSTIAESVADLLTEIDEKLYPEVQETNDLDMAIQEAEKVFSE